MNFDLSVCLSVVRKRVGITAKSLSVMTYLGALGGCHMYTPCDRFINTLSRPLGNLHRCREILGGEQCAI